MISQELFSRRAMRRRVAASRHSRWAAGAFTLIELLTVIFIISLLIAILLPSLNRARDQAKTVKIKSQLDAVSKGLEMWRNDHKGDRYPYSSMREEYPPAPSGPYAENDDPTSAIRDDVVCGAHLMTRALLGKDILGEVRLNRLPDRPPNNVRWDPALWPTWYALDGGNPRHERYPLYITPETVGLVRNNDPNYAYFGTKPANMATDALMMLDIYDRPILYYRANPLAKRLAHRSQEELDGGRARGVYNFEDNLDFTGADPVTPGPYWDFGGGVHPIGNFGNDVEPDRLDSLYANTSFCRYVHNHKAEEAAGANVNIPVNRDTFLLITPGKDGVYGTADDVKNWED